MDRAGEAELMDFCAKQRTYFSADQWNTFDAVTKAELAAAVLFLAGVDWYGHRNALEAVLLLALHVGVPPATAAEIVGIVVTVHDGDTLQRPIKIRLRIPCPQVRLCPLGLLAFCQCLLMALGD